MTRPSVVTPFLSRGMIPALVGCWLLAVVPAVAQIQGGPGLPLSGGTVTAPGGVSLSTSASTPTGSFYVPLPSTAAVSVGMVVSGSGAVPAGDTVASVDGASSSTTTTAATAATAGENPVAIVSTSGINLGMLVTDTTTPAAIPAQTVVANVTAGTATTFAANGVTAAAAHSIAVSGGTTSNCKTGMLVFDQTTSGVFAPNTTISQYLSTSVIRIVPNSIGATVNADVIVCQNAAYLSAPATSGGIGLGDVLAFQPTAKLVTATTGVIASATALKFQATNSGATGNALNVSPSSGVSGNFTVAGTVSAAQAAIGGFNILPTTPPCDMLLNGCGAGLGYSLVMRLRSAYTGPLWTVFRTLDNTYEDITTLPDSLVVNTSAIHSFCDNTGTTVSYDCYVYRIYDHVGANAVTQPIPTAMCRVDWMADGLPDMHCSGSDGQSMQGYPTTGLPTTGSRTEWVAGDNFYWQLVDSNVEYGATNQQAGSAGSAWGWNWGQPTTITQTPFAGAFLDHGNNAWGMYPPGYAQAIGVASYNSATTGMYVGLMTDACVPTGNTSCNLTPLYEGAAPTTINTGNSSADGNYIWLGGMGTDGGTYGGRMQTWLVAGNPTTPSERLAVANELAAIHFMRKPSPCAATNQTIAGVSPGQGTITTPSSLAPVSNINIRNAVSIVSTALINPNWTGPILRVVRADNHFATDIYASGCEADPAALATALNGTTGTVAVWYDQTGHGWDYRQPTIANQPAVSLTGMNGKVCLNFSRTAPDWMQMSHDIWTAFGGTSYAYGLNQGFTEEAVWQKANTTDPLGVMLHLSGNGAYFSTSASANLVYQTSAGAAITYGTQATANVAHFGYVTADTAPGTTFAASQNLTMAMDNGAVGKATLGTTGVQDAGNGEWYTIGAFYAFSGSASSGFNGCLSEVAIYNDVENAGNLLTAYQRAHSEWATP